MKKTVGNTACYGIGFGTMQWSGSKFWGYGSNINPDEARIAYDAAVVAGVDLFDTAEVYGFGKSERAIGKILGDAGRDGVKIATKYAPMPWRFSEKAFHRALDRSLQRLDVESVELYQVHFPGGRLSIKDLMHAMATALERGKIKAAGVSNYSADDMKRAAEALDRRGYRLASNQVEFSLVHRSPEVDGVLDACRELGVTLIAYSPLGRGLLTGKYGRDRQPAGLRKRQSNFSEENFERVTPLIDELKKTGDAYGKTVAQVALNWLARNPEVIPIPGAKNAVQAKANAEALSFELSADEAARLDELSSVYKVARSFRSGRRSSSKS